MISSVEVPEKLGILFDPPLGTVRYRVGYGGRGSTKSWSFARALLIHGARQPLRILCAREFQSSIRDSVHRLLSDQIQAIGLDAFYRVQQADITGANGTEFLFKGLRRSIAEIKSTEGVDLCWVEEAEAVSEGSWRTLVPTIRKPHSEIWVSFNPRLPADPTYRRFVTTPPDNALIVRMGYRDNPWLSDVLRDEAKALQASDPEAYAHVWGGEPWTRSDTQVLAGKCRVDEFTPQPGWQPYYGADWGFSRDPTVLIRCWRGDNCLWVEYEAGGVGLNMDQMATAFLTVPESQQHVIRGDAARPETINEMNRRGFRIQPAAKWSGSVEDGIAHLRTYEAIVIHPRCTRTIEESRLWRYKVNDAGDPLPQLVDAHNHTWDAIRYALAPLIKQRPGFFVV